MNSPRQSASRAEKGTSDRKKQDASGREKAQLTTKQDKKPPAAPALGNLIVVTGPSGVGKGTVVSKVLQQVDRLVKSVSVTTRDMRKGEAEGVDYFFRSAEQFSEMIDAGLFMEWAEFAGNLYGTPRAWVTEQLEKSRDVILEIEVQGAKQIKDSFPQAVLIFLSPPSLEELKSRLRNRATETPMKLTLRLAKARQEMREKTLFQYEIVNDNIDEAVNNLTHIVYAERCRIRKRGENTVA
jgi:guanylate kinase